MVTNDLLASSAQSGSGTSHNDQTTPSSPPHPAATSPLGQSVSAGGKKAASPSRLPSGAKAPNIPQSSPKAPGKTKTGSGQKPPSSQAAPGRKPQAVDNGALPEPPKKTGTSSVQVITIGSGGSSASGAAEMPQGTQTVAMSALRVVESCDPRMGRTGGFPEEYKDIPKELKVVTACWSPENPEIHMGIVDGVYLYEAAKKNGDIEILVRYQPLQNADEFFKEAVGRNTKHGIRLTSEEKKAAAIRLKDSFTRQEDLGRHLGVSQETISRWLSQEEHEEDENSDTTTSPLANTNKRKQKEKGGWKRPLNKAAKGVERLIKVADTEVCLSAIIQRLEELRKKAQEKLNAVSAPLEVASSASNEPTSITDESDFEELEKQIEETGKDESDEQDCSNDEGEEEVAFQASEGAGEVSQDQ